MIFTHRYLPIVLVLTWILYITCISLFPLPGRRVTSPTGRKLCFWNSPNLLQLSGVFLQTILDIVWTLFFLYLFGKPMIDMRKKTSAAKKRYVCISK